MKTLRTVETVVGQVGQIHAGSSVNTVGAAQISGIPGLAEKAASSTLRIYNTGSELAYVKYKDGTIRTINNLENFNIDRFTGQRLSDFKDRIIFETYETFMPCDIDGDNIIDIGRLPYEQRSLRHSLIDEQHTFRMRHAHNARPGNPHGIIGGRASPLTNDPVTITSSTMVMTVDFATNRDPMYIREHNVLLGYGPEGLKKLRLIPHPECKKAHLQVVQRYLQRMEGRVIDEVIHSLTQGPVGIEMREWDLDGIVPYAILIIDNRGVIGDRWYYSDGEVHCVRALPLPGVKDGVYVMKQVANEYEVGKNCTRVMHYESTTNVKEYKLYASLEQARTSEDFQSALEFQRKIALNEQNAAIKEKEHAMAQERFDREVRRMQLEKEALERDIAAAKEKFDRERERTRIEAERYERERVAADEKFRQEQEKFARERDAAREKFNYDQERLARERESFEAKIKLEKTNGKMKFFTEAMKSMVAFVTVVVPIGMKIHSVLKARALAKVVAVAAAAI